MRARLRALLGLQQDMDRHVAEQLGVDAAGLATMVHLGEQGSATPTQIARRLRTSTATTTLVLNRLQASGHLAREPHPTDRRKVNLVASPESLAAGFELVRPIIEGVDELTSAMSAEDRAVVVEFLDKMVAVYERALGPRRP